MSLAAPIDLGEAPALGDRRIIPFDYAFRFALSGKPEETHSRRIVISVEGAFTAVSVGYGVIPTVPPIRFGRELPKDFTGIATLGDTQLSHLVAALDQRAPGERDLVLRNGFRLSPEVASLSIDGKLPPNVMRQAFEAIGAPPERIQFTYALFDDGSGREFQSEPILNTAGLGTANGERPFRQLARPITFAPLAVIRMAITEISTVKGELHVSLHGYKVLGGSGTPTEASSPAAGVSPSRTASTEEMMTAPIRLGLATGCAICGIPLDSQTFDEFGFEQPKQGRTQRLARFELPPHYCGILEYFSQYTDAQARDPAQVETPGLNWSILVNGRPLYPYLSFNRILNPWGFGSFQTAIRLDDGATLELVVAQTGDTDVKRVGGRLVGRYWYNAEVGDVVRAR